MTYDSKRKPLMNEPGSERTGPSEAELISLLLWGTIHQDSLTLAAEVLGEVGGLDGLMEAAHQGLGAVSSLTPAQKAQLMAVVELAKRVHQRAAPLPEQVESASDALEYVSDMAELGQEHVRVLLLDGSKRVMAVPTLYMGTSNAVVIRIAEIYRQAVQEGATAIIVAHNHPSGEPTPSPEDIALTHALSAAGQVLDIQFVDHLIIARSGWRSLREMGLLGR